MFSFGKSIAALEKSGDTGSGPMEAREKLESCGVDDDDKFDVLQI